MVTLGLGSLYTIKYNSVGAIIYSVNFIIFLTVLSLPFIALNF